MCELDHTIKTLMEKDKKESINIDKKNASYSSADEIEYFKKK